MWKEAVGARDACDGKQWGLRKWVQECDRDRRSAMVYVNAQSRHGAGKPPPASISSPDLHPWTQISNVSAIAGKYRFSSCRQNFNAFTTWSSVQCHILIAGFNVYSFCYHNSPRAAKSRADSRQTCRMSSTKVRMLKKRKRKSICITYWNCGQSSNNPFKKKNRIWKSKLVVIFILTWGSGTRCLKEWEAETHNMYLNVNAMSHDQ